MAPIFINLSLLIKALQDLIYTNKNMPLVISGTTRAVIEWQQHIHIYSKKAQEGYLRSFTLDIPYLQDTITGLSS